MHVSTSATFFSSEERGNTCDSVVTVIQGTFNESLNVFASVPVSAFRTLAASEFGQFYWCLEVPMVFKNGEAVKENQAKGP